MTDESVKGDPEDLCRILEALDARNDLNLRQAEAVETLANVVDDLHGEVTALRAQIHERPTKAQAEHRRRRIVAAMLVFGTVLVFSADAHSEACGPGARAEAVISEAVDPDSPPLSLERARQLVNENQPTAICDATFPIHTHKAASDSWPTPWALVGIGTYALVGFALWVWARGPRPHGQHHRRWNDPEDTPVPDAHPTEEQS